MIQAESATRLLQRAVRGMLGRKRARWCRREFNKSQLSSTAVQTKWRQMRGKRAADQARWDRRLEQSRPFIVRVQAKFRGDRCRRAHPEVG